MRLNSLRHRVLAMAALTVLSVTLAHVAMGISGHARSADAIAREIADDIAAAAIPLLGSTLVVGDLATSQETLDNIMGHGHFRQVRLLRPDGIGVVLEGRGKRAAADGAGSKWIAAWLSNGTQPQRFAIEVGGANYGLLEFAPNPQATAARIWDELCVDIGSGVLLIVLQLVLFDVALRYALRPLKALSEAARRLGNGDLSSRAPLTGSSELLDTERTFNRMADNLMEARANLESRVRERTAELEEINRRLEESEQRFRVQFEHAPEAIVVLDADSGVFVDANDNAVRLFGLPRERLLQVGPAVISPPHQPDGRHSPEAALENIRRAEAGDTPVFEWTHRDATGNDIPCEVSLARLPHLGNNWIRGSIVNISARKQAEARIAHLAHHDAMTGLFNRFSFDDHMAQALATAKREQRTLAVLFIDMDNFKTINDTFGHAGGDSLLIEAARRLRACVRESDIVARQGGDEFVVVLTGADSAESAPVVAGKILDTLGAPYWLQEQQAISTPSIGVACFPRDGEDTEMLLRKADAAMYRAKARGRNNIQVFGATLS